MYEKLFLEGTFLRNVCMSCSCFRVSGVFGMYVFFYKNYFSVSLIKVKVFFRGNVFE